MRVAFVGCRPESWRDVERVKRVVRSRVWDAFHNHHGSDTLTFVSGRGRGVDTWAEEAFDEVITKHPHLVAKRIFRPDWNTYGKGAGFQRNGQIVAASDRVVAFWDGKSKGTKDTMDKALNAQVELEVLFPERAS